MSKVIYKCKVDGDLGRIGKFGAMCAKYKLNGDCGAHGNKKYEHKERRAM